MEKERVLQKIRDNREALKAVGLYQIGLFGSSVRGDFGEDSDVDLLLDFTDGRKNFHNYMEACDILESIIEKKVDAVTADSLSSHIRPYIEKELVYERL